MDTIFSLFGGGATAVRHRAVRRLWYAFSVVGADQNPCRLVSEFDFIGVA